MVLNLLNTELHSFRFVLFQVKNLKTLAEALEVFTAEEVVSFKWDKEIADTGKSRPSFCFCRPDVTQMKDYGLLSVV